MRKAKERNAAQKNKASKTVLLQPRSEVRMEKIITCTKCRKTFDGVRTVQQREGSGAGCHVSILRRAQRHKVADGHGIHDNPEEAKRINTGLSRQVLG